MKILLFCLLIPTLVFSVEKPILEKPVALKLINKYCNKEMKKKENRIKGIDNLVNYNFNCGKLNIEITASKLKLNSEEVHSLNVDMYESKTKIKLPDIAEKDKKDIVVSVFRLFFESKQSKNEDKHIQKMIEKNKKELDEMLTMETKALERLK